MDDPERVDPVTPFTDIYKVKIQSNGSLDKLKFRIVVRVDLQNTETIVDTWYPIASIRALNHFLSNAANHKATV